MAEEGETRETIMAIATTMMPTPMRSLAMPDPAAAAGFFRCAFELRLAGTRLDLHDDRDDHRARASLGPQIIGQRVADGLAQDVNRGAALVVLVDGRAAGVLDARKQLVVAGKRHATARDVNVGHLVGAAPERHDARDDAIL